MTTSPQSGGKWYDYLSCFLAGVFLVHMLPHILNGLTMTNILAALASLAIGIFFLWHGRFSVRNPGAVVSLVLGIAAVLIFAALQAHHR